MMFPFEGGDGLGGTVEARAEFRSGARLIFQSYVEAGFTEEQALRLVQAHIGAAE